MPVRRPRDDTPEVRTAAGGPGVGSVDVRRSMKPLDAPDAFAPTYELWTIRRESWLPPFPVRHSYERNREGTGREEG